MRQSAKSLKFILTENGSSVRATLAVEGLPVLEFDNEDAPRVNTRHPKTTESELLKIAEYWSHPKRALKPTPVAILDDYIGSRERDIAKHVLEIRKALRKIAGAMRNANIAKRAKKGLAK